MLVSKVSNLKPLIESSGGVHLTAYFGNRGDIRSFKAQIRDCIDRAHEYLTVVMNIEEQIAFLEPLELLYRNTIDLSNIEGSICVFLKKDFFRSFSIPIRVDHACQVATSFHIKPLLLWLQTDEEFLLLGVDKDTVYLAVGSQSSFIIVDSVSLQKPSCKENFGRIKTPQSELDFTKVAEWATVSWLRNCIFQITSSSRPNLYLAGDPSSLERLMGILFYERVIKEPISETFSLSQIDSICASIREIQRTESFASIERSLEEFRAAEDRYRTRTNIFQIAKAVAHCRVSKLAIAEEVSIFGKIDRKTGKIDLHPFDLDHEDDDILDDLAQMVLLQGGDVIVVPQMEIPNGRPILAIVDHDREATKGRFYNDNFIGKRA
ncbi:MAG: hypothetical protein WCI18_13835 [Pseudomonadota bacterium]